MIGLGFADVVRRALARRPHVESRFLLSHSQLKSLTTSTKFQRPLEELENPISASRRRRQNVDGFSKEQRRRGSITHPLISAILQCLRSDVRPHRSAEQQVKREVKPRLGPGPLIFFVRRETMQQKYQTI